MENAYFVYAECLTEDMSEARSAGKPTLYYSGIVTSKGGIYSQDDFESLRTDLALRFGVSDTNRVVIKALTPLSRSQD